MSCLFKLYCPSKREEGRREGRKKEEIERERERERKKKSLVSKVLTENINSTKSTKRAFFSPLE